MDNKKLFDAYTGVNFPMRQLQNVTRERLDAYCKEYGLAVYSEVRRGVVYWDAYLVRAGHPLANRFSG